MSMIMQTGESTNVIAFPTSKRRNTAKASLFLELAADDHFNAIFGQLLAHDLTMAPDAPVSHVRADAFMHAVSSHLSGMLIREIPELGAMTALLFTDMIAGLASDGEEITETRVRNDGILMQWIAEDIDAMIAATDLESLTLYDRLLEQLKQADEPETPDPIVA
jgi:hypothetical protein